MSAPFRQDRSLLNLVHQAERQYSTATATLEQVLGTDSGAEMDTVEGRRDIVLAFQSDLRAGKSVIEAGDRLCQAKIDYANATLGFLTRREVRKQLKREWTIVRHAHENGLRGIEGMMLMISTD